MGDCQNYIPFLGTLNIRCRIILGIHIGTIILTTTHIRIIPKDIGNHPRFCISVGGFGCLGAQLAIQEQQGSIVLP